MTKKPTKQFVCQSCGNIEPKWSGRCPACGAWNTLTEETAPSTASMAAGGHKLLAQPIKKIKTPLTNARIDSGVEEFNRVLGGGIVPASLILLAGEPGIGKSTLLLSVAAQTAQTYPVLYISGEESANQIKMRADRLKVEAADLHLATSTNTDDIAATIASQDYKLVIVDSIQTMATGLSTSAAGSISQITSSAQLLLNAAKESHTAVILTGHVTKEGNIAGPRLLEHVVDVVMYLEGEKFSNFKLLRGIKNRFGSTNEVGIFEMMADGMKQVANPSQAFLSQKQDSDGSVVLATVEGSRAILVEVQALVAPSSFGYPKRTAVGFDLNRLNLLLAVLTRRAGLKLAAYDVYVNVVGGLKINEPAADLAVALAVASAVKNKPVAKNSVVFGEVGLNGELRTVAQAEKRATEAKKLGFIHVIGPGNLTNIKQVITKSLGS